MPTKNSRKIYVAGQYYHIYSRGIDKKPLFREDSDYEFFLSLFKRYLSTEDQFNTSRVKYPSFKNDVQIIAFCLMSNHIHLLLFQKNEQGMKKLMQSVMTSYSMYFNQKYEHYGPVFQGRYLASLIDKDNYLEHISRYIHLNPKEYLKYPYSSLQYYLGSKNADWLTIKPIMNAFKGSSDYLRFVSDYVAHKKILDEIKYELAHN